MVDKSSQPALMQGEHRGHNIIRYSYDLIISWGKWVQTWFEFANYCTGIAYFHPWKKWVQREKCVLKTRLAYNDIEYNKIWPEEISSHRGHAHEGVVEVDDNCSKCSSTNPILAPWTNSVGIDCEVLMHLPNHVQIGRLSAENCFIDGDWSSRLEELEFGIHRRWELWAMMFFVSVFLLTSWCIDWGLLWKLWN